MKKQPYRLLDLFCGCGGISEGYALAGYQIAGGIDFNEDATKTFQHNFRDAAVFCTDISHFDNSRIKEEYHDIDVIVGGPPCQGFSSANRWQKETDDPRNKLFFQFLRFVEVLKPKAVMIENVRGLLTRDNGYAKERIESLLDEMGYNVSMTVLCASDYGVPQDRYRAIIVGIKRNNSKDQRRFDFSRIPLADKTTVFDAIGELYAFENKRPEKMRLTKAPDTSLRAYYRRGDGLVPDHVSVYPAEKVQERIKHVPQGGNWQDVPDELWSNLRSNRHSSAYRRLKEDEPSCTIDTGNAHSNYFHPIYNRIPSIRESARLQSFPDSFEFIGTRGSKYKQVGNAVPPLLAKAIAEQLKEYIK